MNCLRFWLLRKLAGKGTVIINAKIAPSDVPAFNGYTISGRDLFIVDNEFIGVGVVVT